MIKRFTKKNEERLELKHKALFLIDKMMSDMFKYKQLAEYEKLREIRNLVERL